VELINARWDLESGRSVDFRIGGDGFERMHPFKSFQRKRGGRLGTRFACVVRDEMGVIRLHTEVMLKGWTESATGGQQFSLWIDEDAATHPFAGCRHRKRDEPGEMFKISMVELQDDNTPDPQQREGRVRTTTISQQAHLKVTSPMFVRFMNETKSHIRDTWDAALAKEWVKSRLDIESLSFLDRIPAKAQEYREQIVKPFERWQGGH
jgi:hypothetical protein